MHHVFHHCCKAVRGGENLWLGLGREVDGFGVAPTFKVKGAPIAPPVFIIADQRARWVSRERGFARA